MVPSVSGVKNVRSTSATTVIVRLNAISKFTHCSLNWRWFVFVSPELCVAPQSRFAVARPNRINFASKPYLKVFPGPLYLVIAIVCGAKKRC
jgi:hypothetical protein